MNKRLTIFAIISAVVIIAGIVLYALFGFNYTQLNVKTVEVRYDAVVTIADKEKDLQEFCEKTFSQQGLKFNGKNVSIQRDSNTMGETGDKLITYTFAGRTDEKKLESAASAITSGTTSAYGNAEIYVSVHTRENSKFYEAAWRGAIALAVGAIVALIYVGFRFGFANALAGLVKVANDTLLTLALLAITRIPVFAYSPLLFAGIAAVLSLILWLAQSAKMRENFKDPSYAALTAEEAVSESVSASRKFVLLFAIPVAAVLVVLGVLMLIATGMFPFPGLVPLAVSIYSTLLLAPAVLVPIKAKFDKMKASGKRYSAKKKANAEE